MKHAHHTVRLSIVATIGVLALMAAMIYLPFQVGGANSARMIAFRQLPAYIQSPASTATRTSSTAENPSIQTNSPTVTITVNSLADTATAGDGQCTLREAINNANAAAQTTGGDCAAGALSNTINFSVTGTINLTGGLPSINSNVTINGPGPGLLTVRRSTGEDYSVFTLNTINNGSAASIVGLTITNGRGGVSNHGSLTIANCAISGNSGSGVSSTLGSLVITNSTISGNTSSFGGGLHLDSTQTTLTNCTISGNTATAFGGGGIYHSGSFGSQILSLINCTITGNVDSSGDGSGGIKTTTATTTWLKNTLVAVNSGQNFVTAASATLTSLGNNLDSDGTSGFVNGVNGDLVGTSGSPLDARLGPLANYGGPTNSHPLLCNSPAINSGNNAGAPSTDQRGVTRPAGANVDIGAFENNISLSPATLLTGATNNVYPITTFTASGGTAP
ncbi:MAG: choice-of-anchor Q domain-containing protein [Acidobacteriota bacterium]